MSRLMSAWLPAWPSLPRLAGSSRLLACMLFALAALTAGLAPLVVRTSPAAPAADAFPGWPATIEGRNIRALPMTPRETAFARDFPGRIGRFTDGEREIVLRWLATPTRRLHPAADCFRGLGYRIETRPVQLSTAAEPMSCFVARGRSDAFRVCERITGSDGASWPDVSSWYWHALWSDRGTTWWSIVVATPMEARDD